jgi:hypothetical protein
LKQEQSTAATPSVAIAEAKTLKSTLDATVAANAPEAHESGSDSESSDEDDDKTPQ